MKWHFKFRKYVNLFIEEGDLYLALLFATFLAVVRYFHLMVDDKDVPAAILGVLVLVTINGLRHRRKIEALHVQVDFLRKAQEDTARLVAGVAEEPGVHWYLRRSDAERDMNLDLRRYKRIVFIGVSQRSLADYLRTALAQLRTTLEQDSPAVMPWQDIEIYFAAPEIGSLYEGNDFQSNVKISRQAIAACLTDPRHSTALPSFKKVQFFQSRLPVDHGGSMFSSQQSGVSDEFQVIYVVHSRLHATELKDGITTRFDAVPSRSSGAVSAIHSARIRHYTETHRNLNRHSLNLDSFQKSIWDDSAEAWSQFCRGSQVLKTSMTYLVKLTEIRPDDTILELGSGSGETSKTLLENAKVGSLTLLDASPQMTALSRRAFHGNSQVDVALCAIPGATTDHIDLGERKFTLIIIHQSFQDLAAAFGNNLDVFASWCFDKLAPGGRLSLEAHNTIVETERPEDYKNWEDPLRLALYNEIDRLRSWRSFVRPKTHNQQYQPGQIERAFSSQGFVLKNKRLKVIPMSMSERILMWRVPAVMNSVVDIQAGGVEHIDTVCKELELRCCGLQTMPRTSTYWIFERN